MSGYSSGRSMVSFDQPNVLLDVAKSYGAGVNDRLLEEKNTLLLDQTRRENEMDQAFRAAAPGAMSGDPQAMQAAIAADPDRGLKLQQSIAGMDKTRREKALKDMEYLGQGAAALMVLPEDQAAQAYPMVLGRLKASGVDISTLPQQYPGRAAVETFARQVQPITEQLKAYDNRPVPMVPGGGSGTQAAPIKPFTAQNLPQGIDPETDLIVRTVYGEARGESPEGQRAVAAVIRNRAQQSGMGTQGVIFAPNQFEPWNNPQTRAGLERLDPNSREYQAILANVRPVLAGQAADPTGGATHFYSPTAQASLGRQAPGWAQGEGLDIGRHRFYRLGYAPGSGTPGAPPAQQQQPIPLASNGVPIMKDGKQLVQMPDGTRAWQPIQKNEGPYQGTGMEQQDVNMLLTGDPSSREYAAAYARQAAPRFFPDGSRVEPDMRAYEPPRFSRQAPAQDGGQQPQSGATMTRAPSTPPASVINGMLANAASIQKIDDALNALDSPDAKNSTGFLAGTTAGTPFVGQAIINKADPRGVAVRALIADIGSLKIHDRSGAAVTASEEPRLRPFIPSVSDDPQTIRTKLDSFRKEYETILRDTYKVYGPDGGGKKLDPIESVLNRSKSQSAGGAPPPPAGFKVVQ